MSSVTLVVMEFQPVALTIGGFKLKNLANLMTKRGILAGAVAGCMSLAAILLAWRNRSDWPGLRARGLVARMLLQVASRSLCATI